MSVGYGQILLILMLAILIFGAGRLPKMMQDLAASLKAFKKGMRDEELEPPVSSELYGKKVSPLTLSAADEKPSTTGRGQALKQASLIQNPKHSLKASASAEDSSSPGKEKKKKDTLKKPSLSLKKESGSPFLPKKKSVSKKKVTSSKKAPPSKTTSSQKKPLAKSSERTTSLRSGRERSGSGPSKGKKVRKG